MKKVRKPKSDQIWPNHWFYQIWSNLVRFGQSLIFLLCSYLLKFFVFFFKNKEYMLTKYLTNSWTKEVCTIYYKFEKKKQTVEPAQLALFTRNWKMKTNSWTKEVCTIYYKLEKKQVKPGKFHYQLFCILFQIRLQLSQWKLCFSHKQNQSLVQRKISTIFFVFSKSKLIPVRFG